MVPQIPPAFPVEPGFLPLNRSERAWSCEPINCSNIFFTGPSAMFSTSFSSASEKLFVFPEIRSSNRLPRFVFVLFIRIVEGFVPILCEFQ